MINKERKSPYFKKRPKPPNGIIIHSIAEKIKGFPGDSLNFLESLGLSAHYFISPNGYIWETVEPSKQAYHAGLSKWRNQTGLNKTFIGIELMVPGEHDYNSFLQAIKKPETFSQEQYASTIKLCTKLSLEFPVHIENIVRHSDVSGPDVRKDPKQDPGSGWNQQRVKSALLSLSTPDIPFESIRHS